MTKLNTKDQPQPKRRKRRSIPSRLIYGQIISSDFFKRNWIVITACIVMVLIYITNKYSCQTKMEEVRALTHELEIIKTERIRMRSMYMGRIRESEMQHLVDSLNLGLYVQDHPHYKISANKK